MQDKPPFIASQKIFLLDAETSDPRRFLSPDFFRRLRVGERLDDSKEGLDDSPWKPTSRDKLFLDGGPRRLCLTTDAGIGKTTTLRWAEQQIGRQHPDRLAIYVQLSDLPTQADLYVGILAELLLIRSQAQLDRAKAGEIVTSLLQSGHLVLLVDALDQTLSDTSADAKLRTLARFLQLDARNCSATVAGRPYAIDHYWDTLFDDRSWRFAQLATFTSQQQREYLGSERFDHLHRLDVEVLAVPRALETIRVVPTDELDDLSTAADVYWRAVDVMLEKGFKSHLVRRSDPTGEFTIEDAHRLLAMLAFEMSREDNFASVNEDEMDEFLQQVWQRHYNHSPWASLERFKDRLRLLGRLNEFLEHAVLDVRDLSELQWKNRSLQEFFAGLWLARYASEDDLPWIEQSVYQPVYEASSVYREDRRGALYWSWRFAAEMPEEGRRWRAGCAP